MDGQQPTSQNPDEPTWQFQPGQTVSPTDPLPSAAVQAPLPETPSSLTAAAAQQSPAFTAAAPQTMPPEATLQPTQAVVDPSAAANSGSATPEPIGEPASPSFTDVPDPDPAAYDHSDPTDSVSWTASEFIAHHKSFGWYALLNLGVVALAVIVWFITKDLVASAVLIFAGIVLSLYGARKPRQLQYQLDDHGLSIQGRHYSYQGFRSFSVAMDGPFATIGLMPLKRFSPLLTLYCDPQDEDNIIELLSRHLPHEDRKVDAIDALMRRIRL